jgi:tRNA pseudouridine13 synthase
VEEIPLYQPSGQGDHVYIKCRREGWNTRDLVKSFAKAFGLKDMDIGTAGLKDKDAVAVQTFSLYLPQADLNDVKNKAASELPIEVLDVNRHGNKLKTGHLLGNRFRLILSNTSADQLDAALAIASNLKQLGLPNFYGSQRFGLDGDNAQKGREILLARCPKKGWLNKFLLSAFQSSLFNDYLAQRIQRGWFAQVLVGDIAKKTETGGLFEVEELDAEQRRFEAGEITFTGPIYGSKMKAATGEPGELEQEILTAQDVQPAMLAKAGLKGSRRPGRLLLPEIAISSSDIGLVFEFALPKGSYATVVMREFIKDDSVLSEERD